MEASRRYYRSNPAAKIFLIMPISQMQIRVARMRYLRHRSAILQGRRKQYYAAMLCRRVARLRCHALHRSQNNSKYKAYYKQNKEVSIAQKAHYYLSEPKTDKKELYVQNPKNSIQSNSALKKKLLRAFNSSCQHLTKENNIASRKLLHHVLKKTTQSAGELLK